MSEKNELLGKLKSLREAVDQIIGTLTPQTMPGAINWGDLGCVEACHVTADDGVERFQVLIEEASPEAGELKKAIMQGLRSTGWVDDIEVLTEW